MGTENYNPVIDRVSDTLVRVVYDPTRCSLTREDWVGLHARLSRESGEAVFLDLDNMPRGIVEINHNTARDDDQVDLDYAIKVIKEAIEDKQIRIYDCLLASG